MLVMHRTGRTIKYPECGCKKIVQTSHLEQYNKVAALIHWHLSKKCNLPAINVSGIVVLKNEQRTKTLRYYGTSKLISICPIISQTWLFTKKQVRITDICNSWREKGQWEGRISTTIRKYVSMLNKDHLEFHCGLVSLTNFNQGGMLA